MADNKKALAIEIYDWIGTDKNGLKAKGMLPAENINMAETMLVAQGVQIDKLKKRNAFMSMGMIKKIKPRELVVIMRQLATMVNAGIPVVRSIDIIANGSESLGTKALLQAISRDVASGMSFTDSLRKHPKVFNSLTCSLIEAGEQSGKLDNILGDVANYLERIETLKGRVKKALFYPVTVFTVMIVVSVILLGFVVPQFADLYKGFGAELPGPTQVVIAFSDFLREKWMFLIGGVLLAIVGFTVAKKKSEKFRYALNWFSIHVILFGPLIKQSILARLTRTMAVTLSSGIPLLDSLNNARGVANNRIYSKAIEDIRYGVSSGKALTTSMGESNLFPPVMLQMVSVGEEAGELEDMLRKLADFYDEKVTNIVDGLSTLIEPIMLVVLGAIVGGFVVSMYLPIFKLGEVIG